MKRNDERNSEVATGRPTLREMVHDHVTFTVISLIYLARPCCRANSNILVTVIRKSLLVKFMVTSKVIFLVQYLNGEKIRPLFTVILLLFWQLYTF